MTGRTFTQLRLIAEVTALLAQARIPHWLFGGWAVDFHVGRITRDHGDIEFFIWEQDGSRAADLMEAAGYVLVDHPHPDEASIWRKDGQIVELYFNAVNERGEIVGRGRWAHWPTPENALGSEIRALEGVGSPVISLDGILNTKLEYEHYTGVPLRDKDRADIEVVQQTTGIW